MTFFTNIYARAQHLITIMKRYKKSFNEVAAHNYAVPVKNISSITS